MAYCILKGLILKVYVEVSDRVAYAKPRTIVTTYPHTDPLKTVCGSVFMSLFTYRMKLKER